MEYRVLGRTGLSVAVLAFGAGPVSGLMTGDDEDRQHEAVQRAVQLGINWFDTAPGYGQGRSEQALGRCLRLVPERVHIASKVRIQEDDFADLPGAVRHSVEATLARLGRSSLTLLQLHNGITPNRYDEPDSISPDDILRPNGVLGALRALQRERLVHFIGLTGTGRPDALRAVVRSGEFDTIQTPYNLLNPTAGRPEPPFEGDPDYGNIIADCHERQMGVFAIRVFAGGALLGNPPSAHTLRTRYFPLALYERDLVRTQKILQDVGSRQGVKRQALRFVLSHPQIHAAIIGFGAAADVDDTATMLEN